MTLSVTGTI